MKLIILALLAIVLYQGYHAQDAAKQLADEMQRADEADARAESAAAAIAEFQAKAGEKLKAATLDRETADSKLRSAEQARDAALAEAEHFKAEAEAAKKEAREAAKKTLEAQHNTCPPPEVVPKETQPQQYAPSFHREDGRKTWLTSFDKAEAAAKKLKRLQFIAWGTVSCPHCDVFMRECSEDAVGKALFTGYAPCWITVQDKETYDLAEKYGVNKFLYPCAMILDTTSGQYVKFRPSKDSGEFLKQLDSQAGLLQ